MADDFQRPVDRVAGALPGTIAELVVATGYGAGTILQQIERMRSEGTRVNAVMGERALGEHNPTTFVVDSSRVKE